MKNPELLRGKSFGGGQFFSDSTRHLLAPSNVHAEGQDTIDQVVSRSNLIKHASTPKICGRCLDSSQLECDVRHDGQKDDCEQQYRRGKRSFGCRRGILHNSSFHSGNEVVEVGV